MYYIKTKKQLVIWLQPLGLLNVIASDNLVFDHENDGPCMQDALRMKFLHTADLHLGKVFHDQSLAEEQTAMLEDIAGFLEDESYAALIIAGDVYDRSIPSPEAVELFGTFLEKVKNLRHSPEVLVIPGNHDSASRMGFGRDLFARLGIHFAVSAEECDKPIIIEKDGVSCAFFMLPFLNPAALSVTDTDNDETVLLRSQSSLAEEAARRINRSLEKARHDLSAKSSVNHFVLAAHLFAHGSKSAESERIFIGSAENVNIGIFKNFDYVALGHLHHCQSAGENAWYSGSPLAYSFGEAGKEKFVLSVELKKTGSDNGAISEASTEAVIERKLIKPRRRVTSFTGPFARFSADTSNDEELLAAADDYLEIRLTDRGITENARDTLRKRFPHLLSLRQDEALASFSSTAAATAAPVERQDIKADFKKFLESLYDKAEPEEIELFNSLLKEAEAEESAS